MGRIPAATTLLHGQRSKCADLTEQLPEPIQIKNEIKEKNHYGTGKNENITGKRSKKQQGMRCIQCRQYGNGKRSHPGSRGA
jgi:hypothetical protein